MLEGKIKLCFVGGYYWLLLCWSRLSESVGDSHIKHCMYIQYCTVFNILLDSWLEMEIIPIQYLIGEHLHIFRYLPQPFWERIDRFKELSKRPPLKQVRISGVREACLYLYHLHIMCEVECELSLLLIMNVVAVSNLVSCLSNLFINCSFSI